MLTIPPFPFSRLSVFPQVRRELENEYGAEGSDAVEKALAKARQYKQERDSALAVAGRLRERLESAQQLSNSRLHRERAALDEIDALKNEIESMVEAERAASKDRALLERIPNFTPVRSKGEGKGGKRYPNELRMLVMGELARGTPPSAVAGNVLDAILTTAPWLKVCAQPRPPPFISRRVSWLRRASPTLRRCRRRLWTSSASRGAS